MRSIAELLIEMGTLKLEQTEENYQKFCNLLDGLTDEEKEKMIRFSKDLAKQLHRGY
jgi:hypothetical protein